MGTVIGGLLMPRFDAGDYGQAMNRGILGGSQLAQGQTALLALQEEKQKQQSMQRVYEAIQNDPALAQQLLGIGPVLGSLQTASPPGAQPGPITQSPLGGGPAQQIPAYPDASRYANVSPQGGGPIPPGMAQQMQPQVTPPQSIIAGLSGQPQGQMQAPRNPALEMAQRDPRAAMMLQQQIEGRQDAQMKRQEQQLKMGVKVAEFVARELQGVTDQASLDQARERIRQVHPQAAAQVPQMYSQEAVESVQQRGIAVKDRAESRYHEAKARNLDMETRMFPELAKRFGMGGDAEAPADVATQVPAAQAPSGGAGNMGQRMNNPYNIKLGKSTQHWVDEGLADVGETAQDGGKFIKFKDPQVGERAGLELLQGPGYRELTVDAAMKRWSNNGYGAEIIKDIPPETKIKDLSAAQMRPLMAAMRQREGWDAKPSGGSTAQAPATDPRIAQYEAKIAQRTRDAQIASLMKNESLSTRLNDDANRLTAEKNRLIEQSKHQQERGEEIPRAVEKETALQPLKLAQQEAAAKVALEAKMNEPIGPENALNMNLPPQTRWKDVPKDVKITKQLGDTTAKQFSEFKASHAGLSRVLEMLENPKAHSIVGTLFSGDNAAFRRRAGEWISSVTPQERKFVASLVAEIADIRHTLSGSAVSAPEAEFLQPMLPSAADPDVATVRAKLEALQEWMTRKHDAYRDQFEQSGYRVPTALARTAEKPPPTGSGNVDKFKTIKP